MNNKFSLDGIRIHNESNAVLIESILCGRVTRARLMNVCFARLLGAKGAWCEIFSAPVGIRMTSPRQPLRDLTNIRKRLRLSLSLIVRFSLRLRHSFETCFVSCWISALDSAGTLLWSLPAICSFFCYTRYSGDRLCLGYVSHSLSTTSTYNICFSIFINNKPILYE